ncbi:MAG: two-component system, OmpR family, sensor kinase [Pseudonocardiales bacterium]|nr:two-component system, OmpR family, sensor kinase [Pseudonocardiales bacterium]
MNVRGVLARRTLRTRLTVLLTSLLLVGCATVGIATTLALRSFLRDRLDQQLELAGSRYATALEHDDHDADNAETSTVGQPVGTLGARILNGTVTAVGVVSEANSPVKVPPADAAVLARLTPSNHHRTVTLPTLGKYRVRVASGIDGDILVTGLPQHPIDETVRHVELAEALVFLIVVLIMGLIGGLAIRWSLRPLARVASTAFRVSELPLASGDGRLTERVPPADERTEAGQVAYAVNHMLERIEEAFTERQRGEDRLRQFVADASHELRTPLAVVRSHAELIGQDADQLPESVRHSVFRIDSAARRMGRLVDDLLLLARLDSGTELRREEVDLSRIVVDEVSDAGVASPDHRWSLDLPPEPIMIMGDEDRLHQVLGNLLTNARLHTPAGTSVIVRVAEVGEDDGDGGEVELSVTDDGPGIPAELLPSVGERFVRGDSARSRARGGSGLGLAIVAAVVAAHRGTLSITSRPGETAVSIRLPRGRPSV